MPTPNNPYMPNNPASNGFGPVPHTPTPMYGPVPNATQNGSRGYDASQQDVRQSYGGYGRQPDVTAYDGQQNSYGAPTADSYGNDPYGYGQQSQYGESAPAMPVPPQGYGAPATATTGGAIPLDQNGEPPLWAPWYGISFPNACIRVFKKYATFSGRASRSEYWWWALGSTIIAMLIAVLSAATHGNAVVSGLSSIWSLVVLVPNIAIGVRRLHDTNRSGWFYLLPCGISFVGTILMVGGIFTGAVSATSNSAGGLAVMFLGVILLLASGIVAIVLMATGSRPEGARFDRPQY